MTKSISFFRRISTVFLFFLLLISPLGNASAQDYLSDSIVAEQLQTIQQMLGEGKKNASLWWNGWLIGYSAATAGQVAIGLSSGEKNLRQDMFLSAGTTFLGAVGQLLTPMTPASAPRKLAALPETTPEERLEKLQEAEKLLEASARREKSGRSWKTHAVTLLVNLGSGFITWKGFDRTIWAGLENFAINTAITEAQIFTQPMRAVKDHRRYLEKYGAEPGQSYVPRQFYWTVNGYPGGVAVKVVF